MISVYSGKCLSRKAVHNWVDKLFQGRLKVADVDISTEAVVQRDRGQKNFYAAGFDELVKRWDKCMNVGGGYFEK
jgi:hypothetical protein